MIVASYASVWASASVAAHHGWLFACSANSARMPTTFTMKNSTASPRFPAETRSLKVFAVSAGGRIDGSTMYGGSHSAALSIGDPLAAASNTNAAPEDDP